MKIAKILFGLLLTGLSACLFAGGGQEQEESESVEGMRVRMTFANETVTIRLENTPAARALAARLEEGALTLTFSDFAGSEKIASPDPPLVFIDTEGCDPDTGDLTVYIPWGNLAAFYRDSSGFSRDLAKIGRFEDDGISRLAAQRETFSAVLEPVENEENSER